MKSDFQVALKWLVVFGCVFAPFLLVVAALLQIPGGLQAVSQTDPLDWIWLMLLGAMMLGVYYFLAVYLEGEELITAEFRELDRDQDGYLSRDDTKTWPELFRSFDEFDSDHDGRLSRVEFEAYEHATAHA